MTAWPRTERTIEWPKKWTADEIAWVKRQIIGEYLRDHHDRLVEVLLEIQTEFYRDNQRPAQAVFRMAAIADRVLKEVGGDMDDNA